MPKAIGNLIFDYYNIPSDYLFDQNAFHLVVVHIQPFQCGFNSYQINLQNRFYTIKYFFLIQIIRNHN